MKVAPLLIVGAIIGGLIFYSKKGVEIVTGKRYRVLSLLRGADRDLVISCLQSFGATDIQVLPDRLIYTVTSTKTRTLKLGTDKFTCDAAGEGPSSFRTAELIVDSVQELPA